MYTVALVQVGKGYIFQAPRYLFFVACFFIDL